MLGIAGLPVCCLRLGTAQDVPEADFTRVTVADLAAAIQEEPIVLLPLRVITGLLRNEFAGATKIVAEALGLRSRL